MTPTTLEAEAARWRLFVELLASHPDHLPVGPARILLQCLEDSNEGRDEHAFWTIPELNALVDKAIVLVEASK